MFVEGESRKIGTLRVPEALIEQLREHGQCLRVELDDAARLQLLLQDYGHFAADTEGFCRLLDGLVELRGRDTVEAWQALARVGPMGRGLRRADAAALRPAVRTLVPLQLPPAAAGHRGGAAGCRGRHAAGGRAQARRLNGPAHSA